MKVLLCAIVKNAAKKLSLNLNYAFAMGKLFNRYKIVIYENNSTDGTKDLLKSCQNSDLKVLSEDLDAKEVKEKSQIWSYKSITGSDHPCRMEQICWARNKVLKEINKPEYNDFDYVVWVDFDSSGWETKEVYKTLQESHLWDVVYGNSNPYYDYYALRTKENPWGPEILGEFWWKTLVEKSWSIKDFLRFKTRNIFDLPKYLKVYSAFNGIGVFHKKIFKLFCYDFKVNEEVKNFYRKIFKELRDNKIKDYIAKECSFFPGGEKDFKTNIFWKNNSGYEGPVVCEHVCLNFALQNKGAKILMNKDLFYYR